MKSDQLEFYLNKGNEFGFQMNSKDGRFVGWLELKKVMINEKKLRLLNEDDWQYKKEIENKIKPFLVRICKIPVDRFESDDYLNESDYTENKLLRFQTLDEVDAFLISIDKDISQIKWRTELLCD